MICISIKEGQKVSRPYEITDDYFINSYCASKSVDTFSIYATGSDMVLETVAFSDEDLKTLKQNGIITNDMQLFYKTRPEFLSDIVCAIAFNWENGVLVYSNEFEKYENWVKCNDLMNVFSKLAHYFKINIAKVAEFKRSCNSCFEIIGALKLIREMYGNIEVALLSGE